jgi:hypothetical protein
MLWLRKYVWGRLALPALLALTMIGSLAPAAACSYALPPWYSTTISLSMPPRPPGVTFEEVGDGSGRTFRILNTTATPLYLITNFATGAQEFEDLGHTFPARFGPTSKVVDGVAWRWEPPSYTGEKGWTWQPARGPVELVIGEIAIGSGDGYVAYFGNEEGDGRPLNASPPPPTQVEIPLVYGTDLITIPVAITYALNPDYDPAAGAEAVANCDTSIQDILAEQAQASTRRYWRNAALVGAVCLATGILWRRRRIHR